MKVAINLFWLRLMKHQDKKRVMNRDGRTYIEVKEIIDKQMPEVDKGN